MTKRMLFTGFVALALLATASMVMAQPPGGPGGGPGGPGGPGGMMMGGAMGILMNEEARTAMGVTEEQIQQLQEAGRAMFQNFQPPQPGQAPPDMAQMREQMQRMQTESRKNLETILKPEQVTKMDVMVFQRSGGLNPPAQNAGGPGGPGGPGGGMGFGMGINVESLRALNLTDDQKKKVQDAQEKMMESIGSLMQGFDFRNASPEERQAQMEKMRDAGQKANEEFRATVKGVLTDAQKTKAEELMKDVPEYLQRRAPGPGGPGNRPGGNLNNFRPGEGAPGTNPNREQRQQRGGGGGRQFPG